MNGPQFVHYVPIVTTAISAVFVIALLARARRRQWAPHLVWWAIGIFFYGFGTAFESAITLHGNSPELNRLWYWAGAILGGYPLGTGSLYLLAPRPVAHLLTAVSLVFVVGASIAVFLTPIDAALLSEAYAYRPSGAVLEWQWVRLLTPFINTYAALFLIGGAIFSCLRFLGDQYNIGRAVGTGLIALGAFLPGIGGAMTKADHVEWLYVGEFVGLVLIVIGYVACVRSPAPEVHGAPSVALPADA